ncbi:hypothetical protein [Ruminococcus sp. 210702-SL.1.03]|uniref:hypothetical protein n=1 Tax=Ruminococcus sp. 210702-SL.1.03 TaxID=2883233 RepID=UPI001D07D0C6|nr:hypothetical protein [Ruminococcus sp. 210702-SL.1.03]MCB6615898.1 hypothetical protein [Ruminococcus sp. 210702-SL.1.03]
MPAFGKKQKEESINDKMVRFFKEGKSVEQISAELAVKADVITNVIRRRCGEDSIPETVVRSKNAVAPAAEDQPLKADAYTPEENEAAEESAEVNVEGMSKLERYMLEKEKQKAEKEAEIEAAAPAPAPAEPEEVSMEGISTDNIDLELEKAEPAPAVTEPAAEEPVAEMDGISAEEIPSIAADEPIVEHPVDEFIAEEPAAADEGEDVTITVHEGGTAFDKMKAFAMAQVEANNTKIAELESKLSSVEDDYNAQLADAEKAVEESKNAYENVLTRGEEVHEKRMAAQTEHRAALARAEEEYRKKIAEIEDEYNNANAHANKVLAEKEVEINAESDAIDAEKEIAKNDFLDKQAAVNGIKDKIAADVDAVKAQIAGIKEENAGYQQFMV